MPFELVIFPNGTASVRPEGTSEAMHSSIGPWEEANLLYVGQSDLAQKLLLPDPSPLVLYDIGMGIAANALAAIQCAIHLPGQRRPLHIVSFEQDLDGLRTALRHSARFPFFSGMETTLQKLLETRTWSDSKNRIQWELKEGDFAQSQLGPAEPEVIYYDFYSPNSQDSELWGTRNFKRLHEVCAQRLSHSKDTMLYTYSSATAARAAMLLAGFYVGTGAPTAIKKETTVASTRLSSLSRPLDPSWLTKLERTHKPLPKGSEQIRHHPQFAV